MHSTNAPVGSVISSRKESTSHSALQQSVWRLTCPIRVLMRAGEAFEQLASTGAQIVLCNRAYGRIGCEACSDAAIRPGAANRPGQNIGEAWRASALRSTKTMLSRALTAWAAWIASPIITSAARSMAKPPTPVPSAGNAIDLAPTSAAFASALAVAARTRLSLVTRSGPIVAAWITHLIGGASRPAEVATASPGRIGPCAIASLST